METYKIIKVETEGFYKEKGSKFYAHACPVHHQGEVKEKLTQLKKRYHDARHHCYAYMINQDHQPLTRANDDGEPGHTAGDPILGQIRSFDVVNILVVVVRYFGGTKLGVSGLIHAYKSAAEDALGHAEIVTVEVKTDFKLEYPYEKTQEVMRIANQFSVEIKNQEFAQMCTLYGRVDPEKFEGLTDKLSILELVALKIK